MRRQYLSLKSQHEDCILFFRLGDFYETFDDDAKIVARVCDVVLTSRPVGNDQRVPLAGVPYHAVDGYVAKLIEGGYKVAIAEQVSEPGKGLVERAVTRVVTRGTVVEPGLLDDKRNNYLMAVTVNSRGTAAGIAYCDITTGEFAATQIDDKSAEALEQRIGEELSRLQPSELIHVGWEPDGSDLQGLIAVLNPLLSTVENWQVEPDTAEESLKRHFHVTSLDGFGLQGRVRPYARSAAVLAYLHEMQPSALSQLTGLHHYATGEFMTLDESTRRNLELTETIRRGEVKGSLLDVLDSTLTPMGGRLLRRWLSQPLLDVDAITSRLDAVQAFHDNTTLRLELRELLRGLGDLERWTNRVAQPGVALPRDLVGIREVLRQAAGDCESLARSEDQRSERRATIAAVPDPRSSIFDLSTDCPTAPTSCPFSPWPSPTSRRPRCRRRASSVMGLMMSWTGWWSRAAAPRIWIANLQATERERLDIKSLKVGYNKVFGYYIEVTRTHSDKVPEEYIRKQTLTNAERYITPDLKEYESLVLNADERRLDIEQRLFREVCLQVAARTR